MQINHTNNKNVQCKQTVNINAKQHIKNEIKKL